MNEELIIINRFNNGIFVETYFDTLPVFIDAEGVRTVVINNETCVVNKHNHCFPGKRMSEV